MAHQHKIGYLVPLSAVVHMHQYGLLVFIRYKNVYLSETITR